VTGSKNVKGGTELGEATRNNCVSRIWYAVGTLVKDIIICMCLQI
jgi:hypothetical protein